MSATMLDYMFILQGPIDTADILWGSEIFLMMLQEPELVTALLGKVVRTMLAKRIDPGWSLVITRCFCCDCPRLFLILFA